MNMPDVASLKDRATSVPPSKDGFSASLSGACLPDLVQMACLSRTDGAFRVISKGRIGYLFFRQGQVVHAVIDDLTGLPAALELLKWNAGTFEPSNMSWPNVATIDLGWQNLLLHAARESDESKRQPLRAASAPAVSIVPKEPAVARPSAPAKPLSASFAQAADAGGGSAVAAPRSRPTAVPSTPSRPPPASGSSVRVDPQGAILSGRGAAEELAEIATYSARLAELIGEAFGMDGFSALESVHEEHRRLLHVDASGGMVALTAPLHADVNAIRQKFGL
jgi:hypothetical protein